MAKLRKKYDPFKGSEGRNVTLIPSWCETIDHPECRHGVVTSVGEQFVGVRLQGAPNDTVHLRKELVLRDML